MAAFKRLLVATDFSEGADAAAGIAADLAQQYGAAVDIVTVVDTYALLGAFGEIGFQTLPIGDLRRQASDELQEFAKRHFSAVAHVTTHLCDGSPYFRILQTADELNVDLIVLGTHGRSRLAHLLIGSVAEKVVRHSSRPVLTVRTRAQLAATAPTPRGE